MTTNHYRIQAIDNCFLVKKSGRWDLSTDLRYMSDLANTLNQRQGNAFVLLVDMRGLIVPEEVVNHKEKYPVILDRRNQKGEFWLLDTPDQASHLLKYFAQLPFELKRTTEPTQLLTWLSEQLLPDTLSAIPAWLGEKK